MMELKPCPFCNGEPIENRIEPHKHDIATFMADYPGSWSIECVTCEFRIFDHDSHENAVNKWNRRATDENAAYERAAIVCANADKSTHPADLADAIRALKK